jgi:hypothetical protein
MPRGYRTVILLSLALVLAVLAGHAGMAGAYTYHVDGYVNYSTGGFAQYPVVELVVYHSDGFVGRPGR